MELFRDSVMGQIIRRLTNDKILLYSEEKEGADKHTMVQMIGLIVESNLLMRVILYRCGL